MISIFIAPTRIILLLILFLSLECTSLLLQSNGRRQFFSQISKGIGGAVILSKTVLGPEAANAACLAGDLSRECIGVYKEYGPISKENLQKFAPDMKYVPPVEIPSTIEAAIKMLSEQRKTADDVKDGVALGRIEEAGVKLLSLVPKLRAASERVMASASDTTPGGINEIRQIKLQDEFDQVFGSYFEVDVMIGQALRGQLGVSAVAQIQILASVKEANIDFDNLLSYVVVNAKSL